jgi:hypothetical protein
MRSALWAAALVLSFCLAPARAASWDYTIAVPDGREATFELPFSIEYQGTVTIEASWTGPRLLFFGVEGPGHVSLARRSGPSPQRLDLTAGALPQGTDWKLTVKALPARGEAAGRLRVTVPDAPEVVAKREAELHPPPPPPPPPPAWTLPRSAPKEAAPEMARVFEAVEELRAGVVPGMDASEDACGWQVDFLKYAVAARDRLAERDAPPDLPALRYFARVSDVIGTVDRLRSGTDPVLAGPVPSDPNERRDWLLARNEIVRPIERSLDQLTELLRNGHAPSLEDERWLPRLTACLTACERFFDERVRFGGAELAPNQSLAAAQWARILAAQRVLDAFGSYLKEPGA